MRQIVPGVYTFDGLLMGRAYLIDDPVGLTLIDASISPAANRMAAQIEASGHRLADVKRILITHAHPDHVGALPRLKQLTGAQVIVPAGERDVAEGKAPIARPHTANPGLIERQTTARSVFLPGTPVDRTVSDEDTLPEVLGGLVAVSSPGHSPDHMAYWQPQRRILFCGDALMNMFGLTLPFAIFTVDMAEDRRSVGRLALLEPSTVCFGHGQPLVSDTAGKLAAFAARVAAA